MAEQDDIFEQSDVDILRQEREKKFINNISKSIADNVSLAAEEFTTMPFIVPSAIFNYASQLVNDKSPTLNPRIVNDLISEIAVKEYQGGGVEKSIFAFGPTLPAIMAGTLLYDKALDKIKKVSPNKYKSLVQVFPYWVGHIHGLASEVPKAGKAGKGLLNKSGKFIKAAANMGLQMMPWKVSSKLREMMGRNTMLLAKGSGALGIALNALTAKSVGDSTMTGTLQRAAADSIAKILNDAGAKELTGEELLLNDMIARQEFSESGASATYYLKNQSPEMQQALDNAGLFASAKEDDLYENIFPSQEELDKKYEEYQIESERYKKLPFNRKAGEFLKEAKDDISSRKLFQDIRNLTTESQNFIGENFRSFFNNPDDVEEITEYNMTYSNLESEAEDQADKAANEMYIKEKEMGILPNITNDIIQEPGVKITLDFPDDNVDPMGYSFQPNLENIEVPELSIGGDPGQFTDSMITGEEEDINVNDIIQEPGLENMSDFDIFEEAKNEGYNEVEVANLFGRVPMWAAANVDKAKMLLQIFTKNEKKNMDNVKNKLGTEEQVLKDATEEINILDTQPTGTVVGEPKIKKTIIDSPEDGESAFYSGLEARFMDPNTPKIFNNKEQLFNFLNQKGISKVEVEDNILNRYIETANKNGAPLYVDDMLKIIRQAPMRKIDTVTYGDARYGGTKNAKYDGYQEPGALQGSYREDVLFLDPKYIPNDPDSLPGSSHDFQERYVLGWTRKTDRKATLPVDKTQAGITEAIDEKQIKTIKKNQKKLTSQIDGLYASAYEKLKRAGNIEDLPDIDNLTTREIKDKVNQFTFDIQELDEPLYKQIEQFENKLMTDNMKLNKFQEMKEGQKVTITMADEIQSDILQQSKKLEEKLRKELGELLDLPLKERLSALSQQAMRYSGSAKDVSPEVLKFYTKNETIFRPMFQTAEDMQGFIKKFNDNKQVFEEVGQAGPAPSDDLIKRMNKAIEVEKKMLSDLDVALSEGAMKQLYPNVPFKDRAEWGEALIKMDLNKAANLLYGSNKIPDAATWYAVSPAKFITKRYGQKGGTATPRDQRTKDMKGIGMEEFYGGPDSVDPNGKHYTSVIEKALKRAAKENNSEFKIIKVDGMGDVFAVKITPEMLLPHKTHRKDGGMVYTPELIDIFEAA